MKGQVAYKFGNILSSRVITNLYPWHVLLHCG